MTTPRKTAAAKPKPAETEAEAPKTNTIEYKGTEYSVPADPLDLPMEVALAESEFDVIEAIVGPDQWVTFRATRPTIRDFSNFSDLVVKAAGYNDPGN
jgi:hypothetical protein